LTESQQYALNANPRTGAGRGRKTQRWTRIAVAENDTLTRHQIVKANYVFYGDGVAVYVGQTTDLYERIRKHGESISIAPNGMFYTHWGVFSDLCVYARICRNSRDIALLRYREGRVYGLLCALYGIPKAGAPGFISKDRLRLLTEAEPESQPMEEQPPITTGGTYGDWLTKSEAAAATGHSERTIERFVLRGILRQSYRRVPNRRPLAVINPSDIQRLAAKTRRLA
jgi:hypothetical protein